jgi:hypothetical protein
MAGLFVLYLVMDNLRLDGQLSLGIETYASGLRLMVFDHDEIWVCHKVRVKILKDFIKTDTGHLFKGRLQLDKSGDDILVSVKSNKAGIIRAADLEELMNAQLAIAL